MKALPINLSDGDVARIIAGRQTQIRVPAARYGKLTTDRSPYRDLVPHDLLWVREALRPVRAGHQRAMSPDRMPRHMSRLTLEVVAVKTEKLFAISKYDALRSGVALAEYPVGSPCYAARACGVSEGVAYGATPQDAYLLHWELTHVGDERERGQSVVAIAFTPHQLNIDALLEGRAKRGAAA